MQALDEALDLHNFLGRFSPWVLIAVCLALYSRSALRAAVAALQKPAIGRVTGAEYQFIEIEGERYIAEWCQEEKLPFSGADREKYLGRVTDGNITMRVFSVKGDESGKFLYALWDWEGEFYIRE